MATVDLFFPGATSEQLIRGLTAAGEILREAPFTIEQLEVAWHLRGAGFEWPPDDWRSRAVQVCERAQAAAFAACSPTPPPPGSCLLIKVGAPLE